jgi:hypothetical protein
VGNSSSKYFPTKLQLLSAYLPSPKHKMKKTITLTTLAHHTSTGSATGGFTSSSTHKLQTSLLHLQFMKSNLPIADCGTICREHLSCAEVTAIPTAKEKFKISFLYILAAN